jgi:hypothetical protein
MRVARLLIACMIVSTTLGCQLSPNAPGIELKARTRFQYELTRYLDLNGYKSMAVAGDPSKTHVSGIAYAYPLQVMAVSAAMSFCDERREDRGIEVPCWTYAIGDSIMPSPDASKDAVVEEDAAANDAGS